MGYTTEFMGEITIEPPLSAEEVAYLEKFSGTRRMRCTQGPYYVDRGGVAGQDDGPDVLDYDRPPIGQPSLWCQWIPSPDGATVGWDGGEKFYEPVGWMTYLIDHFIGADPLAKRFDPARFAFLRGHRCNGIIVAHGEDPGDHWRLVVTDNAVTTQTGRIVYD